MNPSVMLMMLSTPEKKKKEKSGEGKDLVLCELIQHEDFIPAYAIKMWLAASADVVLLFPAISCY